MKKELSKEAKEYLKVLVERQEDQNFSTGDVPKPIIAELTKHKYVISVGIVTKDGFDFMKSKSKPKPK